MGPDKDILTSWVIDAGVQSKPLQVWDHQDPLAQFVKSVGFTLDDLGNPPLSLVVEDLSTFMAVSGPALRLQGSLMSYLYSAQRFPRPRVILPSVWQNYYKFKKKTKKTPAPTTKAQAKALCLELGYDFQVVGKAKVDLYDAALIARWDIETRESGND
jgi:hypothetical protein